MSTKKPLAFANRTTKELQPFGRIVPVKCFLSICNESQASPSYLSIILFFKTSFHNPPMCAYTLFVPVRLYSIYFIFHAEHFHTSTAEVGFIRVSTSVSIRCQRIMILIFYEIQNLSFPACSRIFLLQLA